MTSGSALGEEHLRLECTDASGASSHLALRLGLPAGGGPFPFCFLYLHGFGSVQGGEKAEYFRARAGELGVPFCSFDFQGHGESGGSLRDLTLSRNLEDTARVHDYLGSRGLGTVVLIGSSMGGATALWHAARRPGQVLAGLHLAPAIGMRAGLERWAGEEGLVRWRREGFARFTNEFVDADLGWELLVDLRRYDAEVLLAAYRTPTLVLQGMLDASVDYRDIVRFAARAPGGLIRLQLFPDGDHRLTDRKDELWRLMLDFLVARRCLPAGAQRVAAR